MATIVLTCDSNPCLNGGACTEYSVGYGYTCTCAQGYSGTHCEIQGNSQLLKSKVLKVAPLVVPLC